MVSFHRVPVFSYLIIKRIYSTFRFKREAHSSLASLSSASWKLPNSSKRATSNFTPIRIDYAYIHLYPIV